VGDVIAGSLRRSSSAVADGHRQSLLRFSRDRRGVLGQADPNGGLDGRLLRDRREQDEDAEEKLTHIRS